MKIRPNEQKSKRTYEVEPKRLSEVDFKMTVINIQETKVSVIICSRYAMIKMSREVLRQIKMNSYRSRKK